MNDSLHIREATLADAEVIAAFNRAMAKETENRELDFNTVRLGVTGLLQQRSRGIYHLAEVDATIAGQLLITYEWSDWRNGNFWWIQSVYVAPDFRGRGIFKALYQHVHHLASASTEVCGLRLYVEAENFGAKETYRKLGMRKTHYELFETDFVFPE